MAVKKWFSAVTTRNSRDTIENGLAPARKINGRWYCYQRPLRLILEVLGLKGHSFRSLASGSLAAPKGRQFA